MQPSRACDSTAVSFTLRIELEREEDGRWIAEISDLPAVSCSGNERPEAIAKVQALVLRVIRAA